MNVKKLLRNILHLVISLYTFKTPIIIISIFRVLSIIFFIKEFKIKDKLSYHFLKYIYHHEVQYEPSV